MWIDLPSVNFFSVTWIPDTDDKTADKGTQIVKFLHEVTHPHVKYKPCMVLAYDFWFGKSINEQNKEDIYWYTTNYSLEKAGYTASWETSSVAILHVSCHLEQNKQSVRNASGKGMAH